MKPGSFCIVKEQLTDKQLEKPLQRLFDKQLISRIYKKRKSKTPNSPIKNEQQT
jgi:hypothetical protein